MGVFDFLGEEVEGALPEGRIKFADTGLIGQITARVAWAVWSSEDLEVEMLAADDIYAVKGKDFVVSGRPGSWFYHFVEKELGDRAAEDLGSRYGASRKWLFQMPSATVLNFRSDKAASKAGQTFSRDCQMSGLGSVKYRHEFQLITLPSVVDSMARLAGFIDEPIWNIDEILAGMDDEDFTAKFQATMIGEQATSQDAEEFALVLNACGGDRVRALRIVLGQEEAPATGLVSEDINVHYTCSLLWARRTALWAALGEPDPTKYIPTGYSKTDDGKKYETASENLSKCLTTTVKAWSPIWARFHMVRDPRVDAINGGDISKRFKLPMISEFFPDEAAARAAAVAEGADTPTASTAAGPATDIPVPEAWVKDAASWVEIITMEKKERGGVLPEMLELVKLGKTLSASPDDVRAWWGVV